MKLNVGKVDRITRLILGIALVVVLIVVESGWRWIGLLGIVFIGTAMMSWCPIYAMLGITSRKEATAKQE